MSDAANNLISPWLFTSDDATALNIENNLYYPEPSNWLNTNEAVQTISENTGTSYNQATPMSGSARAYTQDLYDEGYSNYGYDDSSVSGYYNTGGYKDYTNTYSNDGYSEDVYLESSGYGAYGESCYSDYSNYSNYSKIFVYFYWTKNNDGVTQMAGNETGQMSPWAMAVQANALIDLVNTYGKVSIAHVAVNELLTASKYNEIATVIGATSVSAGTKITVQHFYKLQTAFNNKKYYYSK